MIGSKRGKAGGYTLAELLMVVALIGTFMLTVAQFDLFTRRIQRQSRGYPAYTDGVARTAGKLGTDVRHAQAAVAVSGHQGERVLQLTMTDGKQVTYRVSRKTLLRQRRGGQSPAVPVLSGVEGFRPSVEQNSGLVIATIELEDGRTHTLSYAMRNGGYKR